tara:strand:+ start:14780 stop:15343 length:564 start_codon:yes stop_codon:yes gene_type:complete
MPEVQEKQKLTFPQKAFFMIITFILVAILLFLRLGFNSKAPLNELIKNSITPKEAFLNNKPTALEFYAEWCEACIEMAPYLLNIQNKYNQKVNIVMLNVDNSIWNEYIEKYNVNGIPQLNFFDKNGTLKGESLGLKSENEINNLFQLLISDKTIENSNHNDFVDSTIISLSKDTQPINKPISVRSHG